MTKSKLTNQLTYTGIVNLKHNINKQTVNKKMLNSGTKDLMNLVTKALAGYDISKQIPKFVNIGTQNTQPSGTFSYILNRHIPLTGIVWGEAVDTQNIIELGDTGSALMLSCTITSQDKTVTTFNAGTLFLTLIGGDGKTVLATIEDTQNQIQDTYNQLTIGTDLILDWYMIFNN